MVEEEEGEEEEEEEEDEESLEDIILYNDEGFPECAEEELDPSMKEMLNNNMKFNIVFTVNDKNPMFALDDEEFDYYQEDTETEEESADDINEEEDEEDEEEEGRGRGRN